VPVLPKFSKNRDRVKRVIEISRHGDKVTR
jgi:hypothetical protein